jgi:hypothetical protein
MSGVINDDLYTTENMAQNTQVGAVTNSGSNLSSSSLVSNTFSVAALITAVGSMVMLNNKITKLEELEAKRQQQHTQVDNRIAMLEEQLANLIKKINSNKPIDYSAQIKSIGAEVAKLKFDRQMQATVSDREEYNTSNEADLFRAIDKLDDEESVDASNGGGLLAARIDAMS